MIDLAGASELLTPLGIKPSGLTLLDEGKVNSNFRVETPTGPVVLRLHHGADHVIDIEESLARRLSGLIKAPALIGRGPRFLVYEWRPGLSLERALASKANLPYDRIGHDLAGVRKFLNTVTFPSAGFFASDLSIGYPWSSAIDGLWSYLRTLFTQANAPREFVDRMQRIADDAESRLLGVAGPPVLVHGDFKASNVLVDESGLTAVLDWEFAHSGTWLSDVGQMLRHLDSLPPELVTSLTGTLGMDGETMTLVRTLDLVNLVDFLRPERDQPKMHADVIRRIAEVCDLYEARFGKAS